MKRTPAMATCAHYGARPRTHVATAIRKGVRVSGRPEYGSTVRPRASGLLRRRAARRSVRLLRARPANGGGRVRWVDWGMCCESLSSASLPREPAGHRSNGCTVAKATNRYIDRTRNPSATPHCTSTTGIASRAGLCLLNSQSALNGNSNSVKS